MVAFKHIQCIVTENIQLDLSNCDVTKKKAYNAQTVSAETCASFKVEHRGGSRISGMGVHMHKCVCVGGALLSLSHFN